MRVLIMILVLISISCGKHLDYLMKAKPVSKYHEEYGIPLAKKIRAEEELLLTGKEESARIVGGHSASIKSHPYLVGLIINLVRTSDQSVCGASLLDSRKLVTAAHCWDDGHSQAWLLTAVLGSEFVFHGGVRIPSTTVHIHPDFNPSFYENDVAVVQLSLDVQFSDKIQPISLPSVDQLSETFLGYWATASGYGRIQDDVQVNKESQVNQVSLNVVPTSTCQVAYGAEYVGGHTLCTSGAGGVGICLGDSGGPLVVTRSGEDMLIGISSFVAEEGCSLGYPSGFARVTSYYDFITQA